jgi:NADH-quinone oxidoreductase subunit G
MSEKITVEIDGQAIDAEQGAMIIEVADRSRSYIPRFCYHKKLSVAANCRMCLVEVEGGRKAVPACATPVTEGMKVKTHSDMAKKAQRAVMEFLLINHPLDCPVCDQGGQCELQDLALGYGNDHSRYTLPKRAVPEKNLGPLIATEMTRCIHCTRCVRFTQEIDGLQQLGTLGRGEDVEIAAALEGAMDSEMSGNVIDVCPVGALTSKPFQFTARAWELEQRPSIAPHDAAGSAVFVQSHKGIVKKVVPRVNESVNEMWLSDRDRFSYVGLNSTERLLSPQIKKGDTMESSSWGMALTFITDKINTLRNNSSALSIEGHISSSSTLEEQFLFRHLLTGLGTAYIPQIPAVKPLPFTLDKLETQKLIVLIGTDIHREQPIIATRIIKAKKRGAKIIVLNPYDFSHRFAVDEKKIAALPELLSSLKEVIAPYLSAESGVILLGELVQQSEYHHDFIAAMEALSKESKVSYATLSQGGNAMSAYLMQTVLPTTVLKETPRIYFLFNVEPEYDTAEGALLIEQLRAADLVVNFSSFGSKLMESYSHVLLPIAAPFENEGTLINISNIWQSFAPTVLPQGEARLAWKVLTVLAHFLHVDMKHYETREEIIKDIREFITPHPALAAQTSPARGEVSIRESQHNLHLIIKKHPYRIDALVRRSVPLQELVTDIEGLYLSSAQIKMLGLEGQASARLRQDKHSKVLPIYSDDKVASHTVCYVLGKSLSAGLYAGAVTLEKVS